MKSKNNLIKDNIDNLTALWKTVGLPFKKYFERPEFNYCEIENSDWPNRLWFTKDLTPDSIKKALNTLNSINKKLTLPYWDIYDSKSYKFLEKSGFTILFEQVAMVLKMSEQYEFEQSLELKRVLDLEGADLWEKIYPQSFGYKISSETVLKTCNNIEYYLAYNQYQPIGTSIVFKTNGVSGIHGVGVIPEMRRKGFAEEIMKNVLNKSLLSGSKYATLQASKMGKDLYLKLGFEEQFGIKNYILQ